MASHARFALVTGSSRGIGRAIALAFAERGSHVAVHYHTRKQAAEAVLAEVRAQGADGFTVAADVTKEEELRRMFSQVQAEFGALDLVSNARPDRSGFYQSPFGLTRTAWRVAMDSQATAFLMAVQPRLRCCGTAVGSSPSPILPAPASAAGSLGPEPNNSIEEDFARIRHPRSDLSGG